jgi:hypothetical protein
MLGAGVLDPVPDLASSTSFIRPHGRATPARSHCARDYLLLGRVRSGPGAPARVGSSALTCAPTSSAKSSLVSPRWPGVRD